MHRRKPRHRAFTTAILACAASAVLLIAPVKAQQFSDDQRSEIGEIIREYLIENPQVMIEVQEALEAQLAAEEEARRAELIASAGDRLFDHDTDPVLGNPDGDVTIVEFFDYNCGFCRRAMDDMNAVIAADPDVRFVLKEFPILGEDSQAAHRVAAAFNLMMPEHYAEFHERLMNVNGRVGEPEAMDIALDLGADEQALRARMNEPAVAQSFETNYLLADALGISGTPSYVVGNALLRGALGETALREAVDQVRQQR